MVSARIAMARRRLWFVDLLYSRTVALIHEIGIKEKVARMNLGVTT
jgi:hypothetical protein